VRPGREPELQSHEGSEWLYVLSGRLRLLLSKHDVLLEPCEVAEFDTHVLHGFVTGPEPAEVLCLFGPQGERLHVRAGPACVRHGHRGSGRPLRRDDPGDPATRRPHELLTSLPDPGGAVGNPNSRRGVSHRISRRAAPSGTNSSKTASNGP
jgi:hypothetical protein